MQTDHSRTCFAQCLQPDELHQRLEPNDGHSSQQRTLREAQPTGAKGLHLAAEQLGHAALHRSTLQQHLAAAAHALVLRGASCKPAGAGARRKAKPERYSATIKVNASCQNMSC